MYNHYSFMVSKKTHRKLKSRYIYKTNIFTAKMYNNNVIMKSFGIRV